MKIIKIIIGVLICSLGFLFTQVAFGTDSQQSIPSDLNAQAFYVSPTGSDSNTGTETAPWKTLQYGLNKLQPGQILYAKTGIYNEKLSLNHSGRPAQWLKLLAAPNEKPIIDGTSQTGESLLTIDSQSYFQIEGFELRNNGDQAYPVGILVSGAAKHIKISNNFIHQINTNVKPSDGIGSGASAILIEGTHPLTPISAVTIENNLVSDCLLGRSEAISISKNVDGFSVINNIVKDVTNIGIDAAGFHGRFDGDPLLNQARNGVISGNTVSGAHSLYETGDASGIYIDGAKNILVENNKLFNNDYGLTVGCENQGYSASGILLRQNIIWNNDKSGLSIGGWSATVGRVSDVIALNNLCYRNNRLGKNNQAELNLKHTTGDIQIYNNIFYSRQTTSVNFSNSKDLYYPMVYNLVKDPQLKLDYNLWYANYSKTKIYFRWNDQAYLGFQSFLSGSGHESHGNFQNPLFTNAATTNFKPSAHSPTINGGVNTTFLSTLDFENKPRRQNIQVDIGPYESSYTYSSFKVDGLLNEWLLLEKMDVLSPVATMPKMSLQTATDQRSLFISMKIGSPKVKTQFYIDTDSIATTGFKHYMLKSLGAEYLIENGVLYRYIGLGSNWKWERVCSISTVSTKTVSESSVFLSQLGLEKNGVLRIAYLGKTSVTAPADLPLMSVVTVVLN